MTPMESGRPHEHSPQSAVPDYYGYHRTSPREPQASFAGATAGEITNPYSVDEAPAGTQPQAEQPLNFVHPQEDSYTRGMRRAGLAVAALGVATTAGVIGVSPHHSTPEAGSSASASAAPTAEASKHAAAAPTPKPTTKTNGTSTAEKAAALASKDVNRLTYGAQKLQGKSLILGIEHDSDNGCLDGTPYANGTVQVQGVLQPGPTVVKIHPQNPEQHPGEPDLVFEPDPTAFIHGIKPADKYTATYTKDHNC